MKLPMNRILSLAAVVTYSVTQLCSAGEFQISRARPDPEVSVVDACLEAKRALEASKIDRSELQIVSAVFSGFPVTPDIPKNFIPKAVSTEFEAKPAKAPMQSWFWRVTFGSMKSKSTFTFVIDRTGKFCGSPTVTIEER
jgi:hypothetical protein